MAAMTAMRLEFNTRMDDLQVKNAAKHQQPVTTTATNRQLDHAARKTSSVCRCCHQLGRCTIECPVLSAEEKQALMELRAHYHTGDMMRIRLFVGDSISICQSVCHGMYG